MRGVEVREVWFVWRNVERRVEEFEFYFVGVGESFRFFVVEKRRD